MADGGKVIIKIEGDNSDFKSSMGGAEKIAGTAFKGIAVGAAAAITAIGAIGVSAVKSFSEYEQLVGGVETLFKKSAGVVQGYAAEAYKTAGMSANEYMSTITSFSASLLQSLGGDTKKAADYGNQAVIDMSDNANKMGTSIEMIQNAYQGFAKQNYTMLDNLKLGYGGTKTEMERLLRDAKKISGIKFNIDSFADVTQAIHVIQTEMGITGTTAKEAATTIQGSLSMVKASWQNLMVGMSSGEGNLDELINNFLDSLLALGENLLPVIEKTLKNTGKVISKSADTIVPQIIDIIVSAAPDMAIAAIELIKSLCEALIDNAPEIAAAAKEIVFVIADEIEKSMPALKPFTSLIKMLAKGFDDIVPIAASVTAAIIAYKAAVLVATIAQNGLNVAIKANPYGLIISAVAALTAGIVAYGATHKSVMAETKEQLKDIKESYNDAKKSIEETKNAEIAKAETVRTLKKELYELEDQIKSGILTENEAKEKREEFNAAANKLNEIIPGIITNLYNEKGALDVNRQAVDNLTDSYYDLAVAKATATAYDELLVENAKTIRDTKKVRDEALTNKISAHNDTMSFYNNVGFVTPDLTLRETQATVAFKQSNDAYKEAVAERDELIKESIEVQKDLEEALKKSTKTTKEEDDKKTNIVTSGNAARTESTKKESEKQEDILKEQREKELRDLQYYHDTGLISDQKYYESLGKYRDKYFEEGSSEWQQYTTEIYNYNKSQIDKILSEYESATSEFSNKLKGFGSLYHKYNLSEITFKNGLRVAPTKTELADLGKQNQKLRDYAELLKEVKSRSNVSDEFFKELRGMSVEEGYDFAKALLSVPKEQFDEYMKQFEERKNLTTEITGDIFSDEFEDVKDSLEETFEDVPDDFFDIGLESAKKYGEGFMNELSNVLQSVKMSIGSSLNSTMLTNLLTYATGGYGSVNNYSPNYYIQPSNGESTQAQLKSIHDYETLNAQRSGY